MRSTNGLKMWSSNSYPGFAQLIRYADACVVCFEKEVEARAFGDDLRRRMGEFGLTVSERVE